MHALLMQQGILKFHENVSWPNHFLIDDIKLPYFLGYSVILYDHFFIPGLSNKTTEKKLKMENQQEPKVAIVTVHFQDTGTEYIFLL